VLSTSILLWDFLGRYVTPFPRVGGSRKFQKEVFMKRVYTLYLLIMVFLAGCASPGMSTRQYQPPEPNKIENEKKVAKSFDETWDVLVAGLTKSVYVINNIDKASRIINFSFSSDAPELYLNCGTSYRNYSRGKENQSYTYPTAGSVVYKYGDAIGNRKQFPRTVVARRKTSLGGRANVYVAPIPDGTTLSVNARYILQVNATGVYTVENVYGTPMQTGQIQPFSQTWTLNTNQEFHGDAGTPEEPQPITCYATGKLERDILDIVK
jgi:hypothetical protein